MEPAWPVFESFKDATENFLMTERIEGRATYDIMASNTAGTAQSVKTPNSTASYELNQPYSPQVFQSQSMNSMDVVPPNRNTLQYSKNLVSHTSHVSIIHL